jgi:hypothetical protein
VLEQAFREAVDAARHWSKATKLFIGGKSMGGGSPHISRRRSSSRSRGSSVSATRFIRLASRSSYASLICLDLRARARHPGRTRHASEHQANCDRTSMR